MYITYNNKTHIQWSKKCFKTWAHPSELEYTSAHASGFQWNQRNAEFKRIIIGFFSRSSAYRKRCYSIYFL